MRAKIMEQVRDQSHPLKIHTMAEMKTVRMLYKLIKRAKNVENLPLL